MKSEEEYKKELHEEYKKELQMNEEEYTDEIIRIVEESFGFQVNLIKKTVKGVGKENLKETINMFKTK